MQSEVIDSRHERPPLSEKSEVAMRLLGAAKKNLNRVFKDIENIILSTQSDIDTLEDEKRKLHKQKILLQQRAKEQEQEISGLTQEQHQLLEEYAHVKAELEKLTKLASGDENFSIQDMRATLAIYSTLFQEVYSTEAHFKILYLLHGDLEEMSVEKLKGATGIAGAMILRACHELQKAGLIEFDINTKTAKLTKRLFPKRKKQ
jgi:predicted nuclease with TOPRIM domain